MAKSSRMFKEAYGDETVYITATGNYDYSSAGWRAGDKTILVNVAMADGNYIRLPDATTDHLGLHVKVVLGIAILDKLYVGFVDSVLQGGAIAVGDVDEAAPTSLDYASFIADNGDGYNSIKFDLDTVAYAGGTGGTVLDFWYTGAADVVIYRGNLISEVDNPTIATHATTTAVNAY